MNLSWIALAWIGSQHPVLRAGGSLELIPQAASVAQFEPLFVSVIVRNDTQETLFAAEPTQGRLGVDRWHEGAWRYPRDLPGSRREDWPQPVIVCGPLRPPWTAEPGAARVLEVMVPMGMLATPGRYRLTSHLSTFTGLLMRADCEVVVVPHAGNAAWVEAPAISYSRRQAWRLALGQVAYPLHIASANPSWDPFDLFIRPHLTPAAVRDLSPGLLLALTCAHSGARLLRARAAPAGSIERALHLASARAPLRFLEVLAAGPALPSPPTGGLPALAVLLEGECAALEGDLAAAARALERRGRGWPMATPLGRWHDQ